MGRSSIQHDFTCEAPSFRLTITGDQQSVSNGWRLWVSSIRGTIVNLETRWRYQMEIRPSRILNPGFGGPRSPGWNFPSTRSHDKRPSVLFPGVQWLGGQRPRLSWRDRSQRAAEDQLKFFTLRLASGQHAERGAAGARHQVKCEPGNRSGRPEALAPRLRGRASGIARSLTSHKEYRP